MNANLIWQHLSDPEYLHVLLNPLPVYGLAMGVLALVIALLLRSRRARLTALAVIFVSALSAWPTYRYGQAGYDRVLAMSDDEGGKWLKEHMRRAEKLIPIFYVVAGLAAAAKWEVRRAAVPLGIATFILGTVNRGAGAYIGYAGGHVRHREFRFEPAPDVEEAHHHHDGAHDERAEDSESKPMDHASMAPTETTGAPITKDIPSVPSAPPHPTPQAGEQRTPQP